jgi:lactate dehydrogenase-like 2-hydroxyacid dehydrogenase
MNTPGGNTVSTAQLALSLISSLARNIPAADMSIKSVRNISILCIDIFELFCRENGIENLLLALNYPGKL